jgi:hypothetical protein
MWSAARRTILILQLGAGLAGRSPPLWGQTTDVGAEASHRVRRLFRDTAPLVLTITADFRSVLGNRDTLNRPHRPATLKLAGDSGLVAIPVELTTRGHYRLRTCAFPPLKVHFPKEQVKGTLFAGNGSLKLVTHCDKSPKHEQNLLIEYAIYRAYNQLTEMSHRARLARVTYADARDSSRNLTRYAFFLEDDKDVARRNGATPFDQPYASYSEMDSAQMDLVAVFEYLIGNTDWSVILRHNIHLLQVEGRDVLYPVAYDFDFSGVVDAPYATPDPRIPIKSVRERLYRGMCRSLEQLTPTLGRVMAARDSINQAFATLPDLDPKRLKDVLSYLDDGFKVIGTPKRFMPEQDYVCSKTRR